MLKLVSPDQKLAIYREIAKDGGATRQQLADKFGVHLSSMDRYMRAYRRRGSLTLPQLAKAKLGAIESRPKTTEERTQGGGKYVHLYPEIRQMRKEGEPLREIAKRFGVSTGVVSYAIYNKKSGKSFKKMTGGSNSDGHHTAETGFNRNIIIGIAYAETERFIAHLSSRLGVPSGILRSRLHELLGREEIRGARGVED